MDDERENDMENFINNAPFALVLVFLVIGFVLLIKGADFFVEGSSSVAKRLHVPAIIIGLTIVAMGTSLPETAVSVSAALTGNNELAVSNVDRFQYIQSDGCYWCVCNDCCSKCRKRNNKDEISRFPLSAQGF